MDRRLTTWSRDPDDRWVDRFVVIVFLGLVAIGTLHFAKGHLDWSTAFARDLLTWLGGPEIGGAPSAPRGLAYVLPVVALAAIGATSFTRLLLAGTDFESDRLCAVALSALLTCMTVGFVGTLAVVAGQLTRAFVAVATGVIALAFTVARLRLVPLRRRRRGRAGMRLATLPRAFRAVVVVVTATVLTFCAVHALMRAVTEWDATVYHVGSAKLWWLGRPDPPLLFGPSVGIQLSINYPPLFPASGAAASVVAGHFDDLYLRVISPIAFASACMLVYSFARRKWGVVPATWSLLLIATTPLMVVYGSWPTSYMLLAAGTIATVLVVDCALTRGTAWAWAGAGVVAGLTALTHVYGFIAVLIGVVAVLVRRPVRRWAVNVAAYLGAAFVCAGPWFVRNAVRLHDPFYPLGTPPLHGRALDNVMFTASKLEISNNATWYWKRTPVNAMRAQQLATALYDRHVLVVGVGLGLFVAALLALRGDRLAAWLAIGVIMTVAILLAPGWYWIRALLPLLPLAAILGGLALAVLWNAAGRRWTGWANAPPWVSAAGRSVIALVLAGTVLIASGAGLALAFAGPNQATWTTNLKRKDDLLAGVRVLGAPADDIRLVFGNDARAWDWLNTHTGGGDRVATFDVRLYYFDRPASLFYLDGREGLPLLHKSDPAAVRSFLAAHGVRYIFVPPWVDLAIGARHPGVELLPMSDMLGGPEFPLVKRFGAPDFSTRVYEVAGPKTVAELGP